MVIKKKKTIKKKPVKKRVISKKRITKSAKLRKGNKATRKILRPKKKAVKRIIRKKHKKTIKPRVFIVKDPLDQLFESQAKVKLLKFFFRNAEDMFQQKDIFKRLRSNIALIRQEMKKLEKSGIIKQKKAILSFENKKGVIRKEKKIVFYLNHEFNYIGELRNLILKSTIASKSDLVNRVRKIGNIKLFVLSGIFTNNNNAASDLLIVGNKINQRKLSNLLKDLEAEVGKELNCATMAIKEFDYRYDMYDRFIRDLISDNSEILIQRVRLW